MLLWHSNTHVVLINQHTSCQRQFLWNRFKPSSKICLLTVPRPCLFCGSLFCYAFMPVCLLMPCGHLLGKGWPLGSRLWCLIVTLSLSHWYPASGVVLDCIDSWSLPSFLLWCFKAGWFVNVYWRIYLQEFEVLSLYHLYSLKTESSQWYCVRHCELLVLRL